MREITERLARIIYATDVNLAIEGGHDCRFYVQTGPHQFARTGYDELTMRDKDIYFEAAESVVKGGAVSSFYERTGVRRP